MYFPVGFTRFQLGRPRSQLDWPFLEWLKTENAGKNTFGGPGLLIHPLAGLILNSSQLGIHRCRFHGSRRVKEVPAQCHIFGC